MTVELGLFLPIQACTSVQPSVFCREMKSNGPPALFFSVGRPKHVRVMAGALEGDIFIGPKAEVTPSSTEEASSQQRTFIVPQKGSGTAMSKKSSFLLKYPLWPPHPRSSGFTSPRSSLWF